MKILGVDPGTTTGLAVINATGVREATMIYTAQVPADEMPHVMQWLIEGRYADLIALEKFTISRRTIEVSRQSDPLDVIGGVKWLAALATPPIPVKMQQASDAKTAYTDEELKSLDLKCTGAHARDAMRHALLATHSL